MKPTRIIKTIGHASALLFCAFWLVATTSVGPYPQQCFTGIPDNATLEVVLGAPAETSDAGVGSDPSCAGMDGLVPGGAVRITLEKNPGIERHEGFCIDFGTQAIEGVSDLMLAPYDYGTPAWSESLTHPEGVFAPSRIQGCRGDWRLTLAPAGRPTVGMPISPLEAGAPRAWVVERVISFPEPQLCAGLFTSTPVASCVDRFPVVSITQVGP